MLAGVLPVYSAPISIVPGLSKYHVHNQSKSSKNKSVQPSVKKQDEISRVFTSPVHAVVDPFGHRRIVITEKTGFDLDKVPVFHS
jgi:hypothetical protein